MKDLDKFINELKIKLNIDLLGIVEAKPMEKTKSELIIKRKRGYFTTFESDDFDSRTDPDFHLENSKSIFVIGMSYIWDGESKDKYTISNYSRGRDYHIVLREKLNLLKLELEKEYTFNSYIQVDSGDLYEKELGRLAGFGYIGKNSLLINKEFGSYFFLGLLVTDIELKEYSKPVEENCGKCNLCKVSCPSGAIKGDYEVDTSICHSYLSQYKEETLETKNILSAYGCDICQEVCPKNKTIKKNVHKEFKPEIFGFDKDEIKNMSNKEFKRKFKNFSFSWTGRKIIFRNINLIDKRG